MLSHRKPYLLLNYPDPIDITGVKSFLFTLYETCKQLGVKRVLVDARNRTSPPFNSEQLLEIGIFMAQLIQDKIKIAVLVDYKPEVHGFFKAVTDTKGVVLDFFSTESNAKNWLETENNN